MKISVFGVGKNGLLSGKELAEMGNEVIYFCKDDRRVENLRRGHGNRTELEVLKSITKKFSVDFTSNMREALEQSNMCFISEDNEESNDATLYNILVAAKEVGENMCSHTFVVDRSPLPVNRLDLIKSTIQDELDKRSSSLTFEVISNPNFLRA